MNSVKWRQPLVLTIGHILLRKRWLVFVIGALVVILVETIEHWPLTLTFDRHFINEIFFYGFVGPIIIWVLLTLLDRALRTEMPLDRIQAEATRTERERIARDLHDKLGQNLGYLHFKLDQLVTSEATLAQIESIQADLEQMRQIADQAYEQVRDTLDSLRGQTSIPDDLADALRQQAQTMAQRTELEIEINDQVYMQPVCPIVKRTILDITQEALNNINKHAKASQATISLTCHQVDTLLTISDNGCGFNVSRQQKNTGHYGLQIMRERAEEVGGTLNIESAPEQGTQLRVQFPNAVINEPLLQQCTRLRCDHLVKCQDENSIS